MYFFTQNNAIYVISYTVVNMISEISASDATMKIFKHKRSVKSGVNCCGFHSWSQADVSAGCTTQETYQSLANWPGRRNRPAYFSEIRCIFGSGSEDTKGSIVHLVAALSQNKSIPADSSKMKPNAKSEFFICDNDNIPLDIKNLEQYSTCKCKLMLICHPQKSNQDNNNSVLITKGNV